MSESSSSFAWIGRARSIHMWNSVRLVLGVSAPKRCSNGSGCRIFLTGVAAEEKRTSLRSGSKSFLTSQRDTPQAACVDCPAIIGTYTLAASVSAVKILAVLMSTG
jgi:hypothetical protein